MNQYAFTTREACEALRCGKTKLFDLLKSGRLKAVRLGTKTLIPTSEIERFIAELPANSNAAQSTAKK
jgi:excisionase family DNA binding protein